MSSGQQYWRDVEEEQGRESRNKEKLRLISKSTEIMNNMTYDEIVTIEFFIRNLRDYRASRSIIETFEKRIKEGFKVS